MNSVVHTDARLTLLQVLAVTQQRRRILQILEFFTCTDPSQPPGGPQRHWLAFSQVSEAPAGRGCGGRGARCERGGDLLRCLAICSEFWFLTWPQADPGQTGNKCRSQQHQLVHLKSLAC